jgi:DNA (cytosine-5)-methyltransferase 1/DNA (cytosine-5)-methyltransferase 3A
MYFVLKIRIKMNILSLFDGMSCGQIALNRIGITEYTYYASEIDKYAIQVTQANYPNTIQLGDVTKWKEWDIDFSTIDLINAGFPCQAWSLAGKQLGDKDPRGMLFWVMLDIIKHVKQLNPDVKFLMENVKMKKEFEQYITYHTEKELGEINKHLINSALVSAQNRQRYYWTNISNIILPEDRKIMLKDIIESDFVDRDKSHCLDANYFKGGNLKSYFEKHRRQLVFSKDLLCHIGNADLNGNESIKRVYSAEGKCPTLTTMGGGHREPKIITSDTTWRKLTPLECERLQTVPDNYTRHVSNSQRYKMLGNGWTVDVISGIFKNIPSL